MRLKETKSLDGSSVFEPTNEAEVAEVAEAETYEVGAPRVVMYTHNRPQYFKAALNALLYSLRECPEVPVTVVLSSPCVETLKIARQHLNNVEVLACWENIAFAGMTAMLRWHNPEYFCVVQDDHILPPQTSSKYPKWPLLFKKTLENKEVDVVYFPCSFDNIPTDMFEFNPRYVAEDNLFYIYDKSDPSPFLYSPCCMRQDFWWQHFQEGAKCAYDSHIVGGARQMAMAKHIQTYHIGWNRDMDTFWEPAHREEYNDAFNLPWSEVELTCLNTEEKRVISLERRNNE